MCVIGVGRRLNRFLHHNAPFATHVLSIPTDYPLTAELVGTPDPFFARFSHLLVGHTLKGGRPT